MFRRAVTLQSSRRGFLRSKSTTIAVAMSGGIDSSVAAMLLQQQGHRDLVGVFMTNWNSSDEEGRSTCTISRDRNDMREVCGRLGITAVDADFTAAYWNDVFVPFLDAYQTGRETPNPDVMCNRFIKFHMFKRFARDKLGADTIATGHYAQVQRDEGGRRVRLLRARDARKDQSYFLSMTPGDALADVVFPVGGMLKDEVKKLATESPLLHGLPILTKPESMGVCFIGKRSMPDFLSNYFALTPGRFVDVDTGLVVGRHSGKEALTVGQGARIGGSPDKYFIAAHAAAALGDALPRAVAQRVRLAAGDVFVAKGTDHPALYSDGLAVQGSDFSWVGGAPPAALQRRLELKLRPSLPPGDGEAAPAPRFGYKARYQQQVAPCSVDIEHVGGDGAYTLAVRFDEPQRAITPGQICVLYDGDECLGGGKIVCGLRA